VNANNSYIVDMWLLVSFEGGLQQLHSVDYDALNSPKTTETTGLSK